MIMYLKFDKGIANLKKFIFLFYIEIQLMPFIFCFLWTFEQLWLSCLYFFFHPSSISATLLLSILAMLAPLLVLNNILQSRALYI